MTRESRDGPREDRWSNVGPDGSFRVGDGEPGRMWIEVDDGDTATRLDLPAGTVRQIGLAVAAHATPSDPGPVRMVVALEAVAITLEEAPERVPLEIRVELESLAVRIQDLVDSIAKKSLTDPPGTQ